MKGVRIHRFGGPEVLCLEELDEPRPAPDQVVVRVAAAGVNFIDIYQRTGLYSSPLPHPLGLEGAGTVVAVGPGVTGLRQGDRVAWVGIPGSYAEVAAVPAARLISVPPALDLSLATASLLQGMTAHYLATTVYPLKPGDTCLVHAAAGGVGQLLTQLAKLKGARVLGTVSTEEKAAVARACGADEVILYSRQDVEAEVKRLTASAGVEVVYDSVGQATFSGSLRSLAPRGMFVSFGQSSGPLPPIQSDQLRSQGSLFFTRPSLFHYIARREELLARAGDLFGWLTAGRLEVRIDSRFPLAEAAAAHRRLESRQSIGKVLLAP
jgi:NADPH2:quinone reductase